MGAIFYAHTNHRKIYPAVTAVSVNGTDILVKSLVFTSYPFFLSIPIPVILADAPIGVRFPPSVAPQRRPKYSRFGSMFSFAAIPEMTGSIADT